MLAGDPFSRMHVDPTNHLGLAHYWARKFARRPDDYDDVVQMAVLGLLRACAKFDPSRGVQFSTYASVAIRQSIVRELKATQPLIRVPEKWTIDRRIPVRSLNRRVLAGDDNDGAELGDLLPGDSEHGHESVLDAAEQRSRVHAALRRLPQRDRLVLELRFGIRDDGTAGIPCTLDEVGRILRVTRERVRQLQVRAEQRLRRRLAG